MTAAVKEQTVEALTAGLLGSEAGRRVGWAKAYEALARVDSLEEQIRQSRDELDQLRRAYSRLLGFVNGIPLLRSPVLDAELRLHTSAEKTFRREDARIEGRRLADQHAAFIGGRDEASLRAERARKREAKTQQMSALFSAAQNLGHEVRGSSIGWLCTCGQSGGDPNGAERLDHVALIVHGIPWKSLQRQWDKNSPTIGEVSS